MGARGERTIKLPGKREVTVLYTNRALAGAEKRLGKGVLGILQGFEEGSSGLTELAVLLHVGMEAARIDQRSASRSVSLDDAYQVLDEVGFAGVAGPVMEAIADVVGYAGDGDEDAPPDPNV